MFKSLQLMSQWINVLSLQQFYNNDKTSLAFINSVDPFFFLLNVLIISVSPLFTVHYCTLLLFGFFPKPNCKQEILSEVEKKDNLNTVVLLYPRNHSTAKSLFKKYVYIEDSEHSTSFYINALYIPYMMYHC